MGIASGYGSAVVHRGTVYISKDRRVFVFSVSEDKWTELEQPRYKCFCMAVVHDKLTTIGGYDHTFAGTNSLLCLKAHQEQSGKNSSHQCRQNE